MNQAQGVLAHVEQDGLPVLYRYIDEDPAAETRAQLPWLTVISWPYDKSVRNGMPPEDTNVGMVHLEDAISDRVEEAGFCQHAVSKTGNGLKELVYYVHDRDAFMERFNAALEGHPRYPIDITFFHDPDWQDFAMTRALFDGADRAAGAAGAGGGPS